MGFFFFRRQTLTIQEVAQFLRIVKRNNQQVLASVTGIPSTVVRELRSIRVKVIHKDFMSQIVRLFNNQQINQRSEDGYINLTELNL